MNLGFVGRIMIKKLNISFWIVCIVLSTTSCRLFDRPWNVPSEAEYDEEGNDFYLIDEVNGERRYRSWDKDGNISYESIKKNRDDYVKYYENGKLREEGFKKQLEKESERRLNEIPERHKDIPKNAIYNNTLASWEVGTLKNGKRNGVWVMYSEFSGKIIGYLSYKDGKKDGINKHYSDETGMLLNEVRFEKDRIVSDISYYSEEKYNSLPDELKKIDYIKIVPPDEPKLDEVIKTLPKY